MGIDNGLISFNMYQESTPSYHIYPGKIISQELHRWEHYPSSTKRVYDKDANTRWFHFYNALHKNYPASEKIVSWYLGWIGGSTDQLWALIIDYKD